MPLPSSYVNGQSGHLADHATIASLMPTTGTAAALASSNPVLVLGQWGEATDTGLVKIGDGSTAWNTLAGFYPTLTPQTATATAAQSGITTATDITGLTVTFTVTAARPWVVSAFMPYIVPTALTTGTLQLADATPTNQSYSTWFVRASGDTTQAFVREIISTPGTYTRKVRVSAGSSTAVLAGAANIVASIIAEPIG